MIEILVNGSRYTDFTKVSFVDSMDNLCNQFTVECTAKERFTFPIKRGMECEVHIDGIKVFSGAVEKIEGDYTADSYDVNFQGRDRTKGIIKNSLPPAFSLKGPITLKAAIEKALKACGLSFKVTDLTGGKLEKFSSKDVLTDGVGSKLWDFILPLAQKRQVLISKDENGDLLLLRPNTNQYKVALYSLINDVNNQNNILKARAVFDDSERCHEYNVVSQVNFSAGRTLTESPPPDPDAVQGESDFWAETETETNIETGQSRVVDWQAQTARDNAYRTKQQEELVDFWEETRASTDPDTEVSWLAESKLEGLGVTLPKPKKTRIATRGTTIDPAIPKGTALYEAAEHPSSSKECQRLSDWKCNLARAKSFSYSCTVAQHLVDGQAWKSGYLIPVIDEIWDIDAVLLIQSVEYVEGVNDKGDAESYCKLNMILPDAYSDSPNASPSQTAVNNIGENWNSGEFQ
jgi:prophage tail gpP-like protein